MSYSSTNAALLLSVAFLVSVFASKADAECSNVWCTGKITELYTHSDNNIVYIGTDGDETLLSCSPSENKFIVLSPAQPLFKELYSSLLSAALSEKVFQIRVNSDGGACRVVYTILHN